MIYAKLLFYEAVCFKEDNNLAVSSYTIGTIVVLKNSRAVSDCKLYGIPFMETATPSPWHCFMQKVALNSILSCKLYSSIIC